MTDRTNELAAAAKTADLRDLDLLQIAKAELPPGDAVRDLKRRFPGAFGPPTPARPKQFSEMTMAERQEFCRKNRLPPPRPDSAARQVSR